MYQARIQKIFPEMGVGGPTFSKKKTHYTHPNTSYLIVILWIDSVWRINNEK